MARSLEPEEEGSRHVDEVDRSTPRSPFIDDLQNLNFLHLFYFWRVAREGSIATACLQLHLTQPTISAQIRKLERAIGHRLFDRSGRGLVLTEIGRTVYDYADDMFAIGREMLGALRGLPTSRSSRLQVGVPNSLPKLVTYRLLEPVPQILQGVQIICHEGEPGELLRDLSKHKYDVILSDAPLGPASGVRGYNHPLGECSVAVCGTKRLANAYRPSFPSSMDGAPFLLPTTSAEMRRSLDRYFDKEGFFPKVVGEFDDSALMKEFGMGGAGMFPVSSAVLAEVKRQYDVELVGYLPSVRVRYFAITAERKIKHPAVVLIAEHAKKGLLIEG
ncbi:MAG: LysR family transcriptional regulator [Planctomycetota bacterium]